VWFKGIRARKREGGGEAWKVGEEEERLRRKEERKI